MIDTHVLKLGGGAVRSPLDVLGAASQERRMELDTSRVDDAVLALLLLGLHDRDRAWKSFDWDALGRLHGKGLISDPVGRAKSVAFTAEGKAKAEALLQTLFAISDGRPAPSRARAAGRDALNDRRRGSRID